MRDVSFVGERVFYLQYFVSLTASARKASVDSVRAPSVGEDPTTRLAVLGDGKEQRAAMLSWLRSEYDDKKHKY